jgi:hypothetical protein
MIIIKKVARYFILFEIPQFQEGRTEGTFVTVDALPSSYAGDARICIAGHISQWLFRCLYS